MMKRKLASVGLITLIVVGCAQKEENQKLVAGAPAYTLAKELSTKLNYMDPDQNAVLISTNKFDIAAGDVCNTIQTNYGNRSGQVAQLEAARLQQVIQQTAESLAERKLLLAAAAKANTSITSMVVDSVLNLQYTRAGGEEKFLEVLDKNGVDFESMKRDVRDGMTIESYLNDALASELVVNEDDIRRGYEEDKTASVRHILLTTQGKSDSVKEATRRQMEKILERARAGEDFAELAKQYTEDPGSKESGGLYSDFGRGRMVKSFEDAAFSVPVGEISDIVETTYGYHILKVLDRKKEARPFEEVRPELEAELKNTKRGVVYKEHIEELKQEAGFKLVAFP
jgi:parvulin-like peptidyl-prolyl isomerase